jgi:hypothetical protein
LPLRQIISMYLLANEIVGVGFRNTTSNNVGLKK